ncbi:MAG: hypothetical protein GY795_13505 [Desulfobacterales bacterium]|nr:hypothetical protein [Desulfobacterales bacterium]
MKHLDNQSTQKNIISWSGVFFIVMIGVFISGSFHPVAAQNPGFYELQSVPTNRAYDWEYFSIASEHYLAVANAATDSKIYKWNGGNFVEFQSIPTAHPTAYPIDWKFFTIGSDHFLAMANTLDYSADSKIYKWNGSNFVDFQSIPSKGGHDWEFFTIDSNHYLALANIYDGSSALIDSKIYKWNGTNFAEFQSVSTSGAMEFEYFMIDSDHYLAVANHATSNSNRWTNSKIYKWNGSSFAEFQSFYTFAACDWEHFTIGTDHYLARASYRTDSEPNHKVICKWNGSSFVEVQSFSVTGAHDWEFFVIGNDYYLCLSMLYEDSKIYKWNGTSFAEFQSIPTGSSSRAVEDFTIDGDYYLAVANSDNDSVPDNDSKIFKFASCLLYIDAATGSDTTGDGSATNPFATIQHGINVASNGCTVVVQTGQQNIITGDVVVSDGITLMISPGATIRFADSDSNPSPLGDFSEKPELIIGNGGILIADGTSNLITFTSANISPAPGDWGQIKVNYASPQSLIKRCQIQYAKTGIKSIYTMMTISNNTISQNAEQGLNLNYSSGPANGNAITGNGTVGISIWDHSGQITNNTITGNGQYGIYMAGYNSDTTIHFNIITSNPVAIHNELRTDINATENDFGTDNPAVIDSLIYDFNDNSYRGLVAVNSTFNGRNVNIEHHVASDEIWSGVKIIDKHYWVEPGVKITIQDGTQVLFDEGFGIFVQNNSILDVQGTNADPVTFALNTGASYFGTIKFNKSDSSSQINASNIQFAKIGVSVFLSSPKLNNSTITSCQYNGIWVFNYSIPIFDGLRIINNGSDGIWLDTIANPTITNTEVSGNGGDGIKAGYYSSPTMNKVDLINNAGWGLNIDTLYEITSEIRINYSNICNNTAGGIRVDKKPSSVDARHNCWGTDNQADIEARIQDGNDTAGFGIVDFSNWVSCGQCVNYLYVDASFNGTETGTASAPYNTITEAIINAAPNATIRVAKGIYTEVLTITNISGLKIEGGWNNNIGTWSRDNPLNPNFTAIMAGNSSVTINMDNAPDTLIEGFTVIGTELGVNVENSTNVNLDRNIIHTYKYNADTEGTRYENSSGNITRNRFHIVNCNAAAYGISLKELAGNVRIENNIIYPQGNEYRVCIREIGTNATPAALLNNELYQETVIDSILYIDGNGQGNISDCTHLNDGTLNDIPDQGGNFCNSMVRYAGCTGSGSYVVVLPPPFDTDGDGMPDNWEIYYFGDLSRDGTGDFDGDGVTDLQEYINKTNPVSTFSVTFIAGSNGSITGNTSQMVDYGENCTAATAIPTTNYKFVNWTWSDGSSTANPLTYGPVTTGITITANFEAIPSYTVTFIAKPDGNGSISGITSQTVKEGKNCTAVTAVPAADYNFVNWTWPEGSSTSNPLTYGPVINNVTVTANFGSKSNICCNFSQPRNTNVWMDISGKIYNDSNQVIPDGDEIAVFVDDGNGGLLIVGYGLYGENLPGSYGVIHVYGDDTTTPEKDGAVTGDTLILKTCSNADCNECRHTLISGDNTWEPGVQKESDWKCEASYQRIPLHTGWNLFSFGVNKCYYVGTKPTCDMIEGIEYEQVGSISDILSSIDGQYSYIQGFDCTGAKSYNLSPFSDMKYMAAGYGYWIKINDDAVVDGNGLIYLELEGTPAASDNPIPLQEGWNLVGYLGNKVEYKGSEPAVHFPEDSVMCHIASDDIGDAFCSIDGEYSYVRGFDKTGAKSYNLSPWSDMKYVGPGYGYWIKAEDEIPNLLWDSICVNCE